ncbi:MAG: bifunctional precorrin-2 dehydrogenase/sirohydrochlorin ferrochelatase [Bacteroidales bacterium]
MFLYPVNLILKDVPCLVVGGGAIAERKAESLINAGAKITLISPVVTKKLEKIINAKIIVQCKRKYRKGDLKGFFLIIAATDESLINEKIYKEAQELGILINCVDIPEKCNFYIPSVIQRGDLQLAISSSGKVPYFTKKLREFLEGKFDNEFEKDLENLHQLRKKIIEESGNDTALKERKFEELLKPRIAEIFKKIDNK